MKLNKQTLSEQIYQILRTDILMQRIPGGTKLTLKSLIERFGVSSTPIREALTRLSEEQLVSYYSNVGVSVVELSDQDLREIYEFMGDLDALAISYASSSDDIASLKQELSENLRAAEQALHSLKAGRRKETEGAVEAGRPGHTEAPGGWDATDAQWAPGGSGAADTQGTSGEHAEEQLAEFIRCSDEFHLLFYKYCGNTRLIHSARRMRSQMSIAAYRYEKDIKNLFPIHEEHKQIFEAFHSGDFSGACSLMRLHMQHSLQYALELNRNDSRKEQP